MGDDELAEHLLAEPLWTYERVGIGSRLLEFLPGGALGRGAGGVEQRWEAQGGCVYLLDAGRRTVVLRPAHGGGELLGQWLHYEEGAVRLSPAPPPGCAAAGPDARFGAAWRREVASLACAVVNFHGDQWLADRVLRDELAGTTYHLQAAGPGGGPSARVRLGVGGAGDRRWAVSGPRPGDARGPVLHLYLGAARCDLRRWPDGVWRCYEERVILCPV